MTRTVDPATLRAELAGPGELALLDVREAGQFGAAHLFSAVPLPYSRLEIDAGRLVPNPRVRVVLCDEGDGVGVLAARRLEALGYTDVRGLEGPPATWSEAGFPLFEGVNTISKTFGELVEHAYGTPRIGPAELAARMARGDSLLVVDGRPYAEYRKMNIPGSVCCPNGELALRMGVLAPDPQTTVVVNCAGRTRSIIGAQTLINLGIENPVFALENGTQGWFLADLELEHGASRRYPEGEYGDLAAARARAAALIDRYGVPCIETATANAWLADQARTTYLFDVCTAEEFAADGVPAAVHAPGGQLLQATDQWMGVRGARAVLIDRDGVRAGVVAMWLRQMGHDAVVLARSGERSLVRASRIGTPAPPALPLLEFAATQGMRRIDLRGSAAYRAGHAPGTIWSIRPRVVAAAAGARRVALIADDGALAALAAADLAEAGVEQVVAAANAPTTERTPDLPADENCIDFVQFAHARHEGNRAAALQYLRWETELVSRLTAAERSLFAVEPRSPGA